LHRSEQKRLTFPNLHTQERNISRVLILGAGGYIGSAVASVFRRNGWTVYGIIRSSKDVARLQSLEIIPFVIENTSEQGPEIEKLMSQSSVVIDTSSDMTSTTANTFWNYFVKANTASPQFNRLYIYTTGILVYGPHPNTVVDENTPLKTTALGKPRQELEHKVISTPGIHGTVIRPGWVFGGSHGRFLDPWFTCSDIKDGVLKGNSSVRWSWVHVEDLAEAYYLAAKNKNAVAGEVINIGADHSPSYGELRRTIAQVAGYKGEIKFEEVTKEENTVWLEFMFSNVVVKNAKARELLGWVPKYPGFLDDLETYYVAFKASRQIQALETTKAV